jgi:hypothetical protein
VIVANYSKYPVKIICDNERVFTDITFDLYLKGGAKSTARADPLGSGSETSVEGGINVQGNTTHLRKTPGAVLVASGTHKKFHWKGVDGYSAYLSVAVEKQSGDWTAVATDHFITGNQIINLEGYLLDAKPNAAIGIDTNDVNHREIWNKYDGEDDGGG